MGVSTPGTAPAAAQETRAAAAPGGEAAPSEAEDQEKGRQGTEADLKAEKQHLERAKQELQLLQREYNLQRQTFYSHTEYASDKEGKAALDSLAGRVSAKSQEIEQAQQKISELEEKFQNLNRTLGPKKKEPPTSDQEREEWVSRIRPLRE
jgi:chromosome segregation ATPase